MANWARRLIAVTFAGALGCGAGGTAEPEANSEGLEDPADDSDETDEPGGDPTPKKESRADAQGGDADDGGARANGTGDAAARPKDGRKGMIQPFSCPECILDVPQSYTPGKKAPLLVALHGDGETDGASFYMWAPVTRPAGALLLIPVCANCGPTRSFWRWFENKVPGNPHDPKWIERQIDAVAREYDIDEQRIYFTGSSGGADYLAYWAPANYKRVAAVCYVVGGAAGYKRGLPCPPEPCKFGAYFLTGSNDFSISYSKPMYQWYQTCGGHDATWQEEPNVGHEAYNLVFEMKNNRKVWNWMTAHSACGG